MLKIVNPISDLVFKYLMDNNRIAKKIVSSVIDMEVIELEVQANDATYINEQFGLQLLRYDFKARVQTSDGIKTILIEVQKSNRIDPILRFRKYLGQAYLSSEVLTNENGDEERIAHPIISIYFLGYKMPEYPYPAILVDNAVFDISTGEPIKTKNEFVRLLTHRCYILQPRRPIKNRVTALDKLLNIFYQNTSTTSNKILEIDETEYKEEVEFLEMLRSLHSLTEDEKVLSSMDLEDEVLTVIDKKEKQIEEERKQKEEALRREVDALKREEDALKREEKERKQKEEALKREEEERRQKEEAHKEIERLMRELKTLKKGGN